MRELIRKLFADIFQCDPAEVADSSSPETVPGWDSFGHLALVDALQSEFRVRFEVEDISRMESVAHIEQILRLRGAGP